MFPVLPVLTTMHVLTALAVLAGAAALALYALRLRRDRRRGAAREQQLEARNAMLEQQLAERAAIDRHSTFSVADRAGRIVAVNDALCRISGYGRDELLGQFHSILSSGIHDAGFWTAMWRIIASGKPWRGDICNRAKNGSLYWIDTTIAPICDLAGRVQSYVSIRTDITAAKLTEQRLRASEEFLDRIGRIAGVGGWELDLRTEAVAWSAQTRRILEVEPDFQANLAGALNFYAAESRPILASAIADSMRDGTGWDLELQALTAVGRAIWVRAVGTCEFEGGKPVRMTGSFQDISDSKQTKERLLQATERFTIASEAAAIGIWELDATSNTLAWDDQMYRIYGEVRSAASEPYTLWACALHPDDRARCEAEIVLALHGGRQFNSEFRIIRPDGEIRYLQANARTRRSADAGALLMVGANIDITERRRVELEFRATASLLRTVLHSATEVSIIATDPNLNITVFNTGAERLLGYASAEVVGCATPILFHDAREVQARGAELTAQLGFTVEGARVFVDPSTLQQAREWTYVRKDGSRVAVSLVVTALESDGGELLGYLGVAHDVTGQKRFEGSLREATYKAEQANRAKSQFLANISHEIRTPMNAVMGLSYLLGHTALDPEQAGFVAHINLAGKALLGVINSVLDLSKIEAGELIIECVTFNPHVVLGELADLMAVQADAKGIAFALDVADDLPQALEGDALRLGQILTNLLSNAIKFTDQGRVDLQVTLAFVVRDTGIGIAPELQQHLFAPFAQADASITRRFGGTGLGLSIVKHLAKVMGGTVRLKSTPGVGSEFTLELDLALGAAPAQAVAAPAALAPGGHALRGLRVLVVDDSDITFDVVLMDVQMPVLDGHGATRRIRVDLGLTRLPIIALTAGALSSERARAEAAGMDDFIIKPFDVQSLVDGIRRHCLPRVEAGSAMVEPVTQATQLQLQSELTPRAQSQPRPQPRSQFQPDSQSPPRSKSQSPPLAQPGPQPSWPQIDGIDMVTATTSICSTRSSSACSTSFATSRSSQPMPTWASLRRWRHGCTSSRAVPARSARPQFTSLPALPRRLARRATARAPMSSQAPSRSSCSACARTHARHSRRCARRPPPTTWPRCEPSRRWTGAAKTQTGRPAPAARAAQVRSPGGNSTRNCWPIWSRRCATRACRRSKASTTSRPSCAAFLASSVTSGFASRSTTWSSATPPTRWRLPGADSRPPKRSQPNRGAEGVRGSFPSRPSLPPSVRGEFDASLRDVSGVGGYQARRSATRKVRAAAGNR